MPYRAQFAYPTPPGCRDEDFLHYFDGSNTPLLAQDISGQTIVNIPLALEQDAPFYWRGWKFGGILELTNGVPVQYEFPNVFVKLRDCYENNLQDDWVPAVESGFPQNPLQFNHALLSGPPVPLEPEIYCPRGGVILLALKAPTLGAGPTNTYFPRIILYGVKRFKDCG